MRGKSEPQNLEILVGWLPAQVGGSLAHGSKALVSSVLYADRITVLCPQSDDALEMDDYFELKEAVPGAVEFLALDSGYLRCDADGEPIARDDGNYFYDPIDVGVWQSVAETLEEQAGTAITEGRQPEAIFALASLFFLDEWGAYEHSPAKDAIARFKSTNRNSLEEAALFLAEHRAAVSNAVVPQLLLGVFLDRTRRTSHALLDDVRGALGEPALADLGREIDLWARVRSTEAAFATTVLRRLPSPAELPWDVVADVRSTLQAPLQRFRGAMARLAPGTTPPYEKDHAGHVEHLWRTEILPALDELEELVRETSLRSVFFADVAGDLKAYAGPAIGLATALGSDIPALVSAAIAAVTPAVSTIAAHDERQRAVDKHEFLFLREVRKRATAP